MSVVSWQEFVALLTSVGFGIVSAVLPIVNAETYVVASQVSHMAGVLSVAVGVGIGQTIGKLLLFLGVRRGKEFGFVRKQREKVRARPGGPMTRRFRIVVHQLLVLVGTKKWGLPIVLLAAVIGVPPLYAVALLAGATSMRVLWFTVLVLVGRVGRFVLVALGVGGISFWD